MKLLFQSKKAVSIHRAFALKSLFHAGAGVAPGYHFTQDDSLRRRISRAGDPKTSVVPLIDQWLDEGKKVDKSELMSIIKMLRRYNRISQALEVWDWMSEQNIRNLSSGDFAVRLDLISRAYGIQEAEQYFDSIPVEMRDYHVYGALLNSYGNRMSLKKAEALMQQMRELNYARGPLPYNVMLKLYSRFRHFEKLEKLMHEMEEKGVEHDNYTFNIRLHAYAASSDINGMEAFLLKREANTTATMEWHAYVTAANGYLKTGLNEKALMMLRRSEQLVFPNSRKDAYEVLMTVYAAAGKKEDVYRLWRLYKNLKKFYNSGYMCVISSLLKLGDFDGAEQTFKEWESGHLLFDFRVPNLLVSAHCKKGCMEKAEELINKFVEDGKVPDSSTWERLALGYKVGGQMEKALQVWKKAIFASKPKWRPNPVVLVAVLDYVEAQEKYEAAKELLGLLNQRGHITNQTYDRLVNDIRDGNLSSNVKDALGLTKRHLNAAEEGGPGPMGAMESNSESED